MHKSLAALSLALPTLVIAAWWWSSRPARPVPESTTVAVSPVPRPDPRLARLEERLERLAAQLEAQAAALESLRGQGFPAARESAGDTPPPSAIATSPAGPVGPEWHLEQYVRSFDGGGAGSEFHRLAVEAYVPTLVRPIADLLLGVTERPDALLVSLARLFGDARLVGHAPAEQALLALLTRPKDLAILSAALRSLAAIGDLRTAWALEALVWRLDIGLQRQALSVLVELFGEQANAAVARLLRGAPDEATSIYLLGLLRPTEIQAALDAFGTARSGDVPLRLAGAERIGAFHDGAVIAFVEQWLGLETDEGVRRALGAARARLSSKPPYGALQATGPPDADPHADDPRAWASQEPDAGPEWLELVYPQPLRVSSVRVFQVNSGGALAELVAIEPGGARHTLWTGNSSTAPGPFEITVPTTSFRVGTLRLVLDTRRARGWNEIDAVELRGPDGAAWASGARASSAFGAGRAANHPLGTLLR